MKEKRNAIVVPIEIDEEKLKRVKKLLDEIKISIQEVKSLLKHIV